MQPLTVFFVFFFWGGGKPVGVGAHEAQAEKECFLATLFPVRKRKVPVGPCPQQSKTTRENAALQKSACSKVEFERTCQLALDSITGLD